MGVGGVRVLLNNCSNKRRHSLVHEMTRGHCAHSGVCKRGAGQLKVVRTGQGFHNYVKMFIHCSILEYL